MNHAKSYKTAHFRNFFQSFTAFSRYKMDDEEGNLVQNRMKDLETENQENYTDLNRVITGIH